MKKVFGDYLKEQRETEQISVRKFSQQIGISAEYLSKIENGLRSAPKDDVLENIANRLALTEEEKENLYDLAAESKGNNSLASDLIVYINNSDSLHKVLRISKRYEIKDDEWQEILNYLSEKYL